MLEEGPRANKAKIARRVVEVLEYFDDLHQAATVMDIARRYNRPQSSTSELMAALTELGLLHKDPFSREHSLTPRAALLGTAGQSDTVRDGRLVRLMDDLISKNGLCVALFSAIKTETQIVLWRHGKSPVAAARRFAGGMKERLVANGAGIMLMSAISSNRCEGLLRRINSEVDERLRFRVADLMAEIDECRHAGFYRGSSGFGLDSKIVTTLLPCQPANYPVALGIIYNDKDTLDTNHLLGSMREAIDTHLLDTGREISFHHRAKAA